MNVEQALHARRSVRAFLPQSPDAALVRTLMEQSANAASGGNLQPWRVLALTGEPLQQLLTAVAEAEPQDAQPGLSYPPNLWEPYRSRRFANGEELYQSLGIPRDDKPARLEQLARNGQFFGAPVGLIVAVDERMGLPQWVDLGIYLQSFMLLACANGLATCAQGFWRRYNDAVTQALALPEGYHVAFGIALGYEDKSAPINGWRATRAPLAEWGALRGFD
ncbi:nitroreductase [Delftia sp. WSY_4]|uniref:nitroreductase n=1 Tax=unclassified Delftia TaxID=2613839 RepID=UPI00135EBEC9|nr:nitroreductase [Delftia sp. CH05]MXN31574.1 nitroreductase [Delftia sp. CH05]